MKCRDKHQDNDTSEIRYSHAVPLTEISRRGNEISVDGALLNDVQ